MTQVFINLSTLELDGNYLEQVKARLESYKASLETDPHFSWLGSQEETLDEISYIAGTVTRENGRTEPLFLNANDKIRPPMNTLRDGDTFEIDDINLDIAGSEMETEAVKKLVEKLFNH